MCPVGGMAKFSDALGVQFDYESGSIGCLRSATAVCLYREGHQHQEIMVPRRVEELTGLAHRGVSR